MNWLKGSWFLRMLALALAVLTYFYVRNEIMTLESQRRATDPSYKLIKLTAKSLPLKVRLAAGPSEGHRIIEDKVSSHPARVIVIGPEALLEEAFMAETALVDVGDSAKTVTRRIPLESVAGIHLVGEPYNVEVTIPIEKVQEKK
ncbi:MAG: YbbR-like domain-containing protein [Candidatus Omnitrophica bacterium]|nr:YbbR-like domain-containing protein [Candidatus Omnitrophota bacterium]